MTSRFLIGSALILLLSACASYEPHTHSVAAPNKSASYTAGQDGLSVYAVVLSSEAQQESYFDADLSETGVVAIQVMAENQTEKPMMVDPYKTRLELPGSQSLSPLDPSAVARMVDEDGSVTGSSIAFGLIGYLVAANAEQTAKNERETDYRNKAFKQTVLYQGQAHNGVLFFGQAPGAPTHIRGDLKVSFLDQETSEAKVVSVPLSGGIPNSTNLAATTTSGGATENPNEGTSHQSLDGLWRARGANWTVEIDILGDVAKINAVCNNAQIYNGHGTVDSEGNVVSVSFSPRNTNTPTLSGPLENMLLYANGFTCLRDELHFERV